MTYYFLLTAALFVYFYVNWPHRVVCQDCNFHGPVRKNRRGSWGLELGLWFTLILPGLLYSIWRSAKHKFQCADCEGDNVIPSKSLFIPVLGKNPLAPSEGHR
jgi:hypothetical protein